MLVTVEGIVVGKRDVGESNCFLDILTSEYGVIEVTAHGLRKQGSKNASATGLFSYSIFCLNKTDLRYSINSTQPKYNYFGLSADLKKLSLAVYLADIIKYTSAAEQHEGDILRFFAITLYEIERANADCTVIKSVFELRIMSMLGFMPDLRACRNCGEYAREKMFFSVEDSNLFCGECEEKTRSADEEALELSPVLLHTMRYVVFSNLEKVYGFTLSGITRTQFSEFAEQYLLRHLGRSFKTLDYYKKTEENFYE